jgi:hypothetical protein
MALKEFTMIIWAHIKSYFTSLKLIKAWSMNELVTLKIHFAKLTEDIIEVLEIDILPMFSK